MTEKQKHALNKIIAALPDDCRESYLEIANYAISLGYMPVLTGKHKDDVDFRKSKTKRTILKIKMNPKFRRIAMRFYALPEYTGVFKEALDKRFDIQNKIEIRNKTGQLGDETHCSLECGLCDGTHGYSITLPDGKKGYFCGHDVVTLPTFCAENIPEVKAALKTQDDFYMQQISS